MRNSALQRVTRSRIWLRRLLQALNWKQNGNTFRNQVVQALDLLNRRYQATWLRKSETNFVTRWFRFASLERCATLNFSASPDPGSGYGFPLLGSWLIRTIFHRFQNQNQNQTAPSAHSYLAPAAHASAFGAKYHLRLRRKILLSAFGAPITSASGAHITCASGANITPAFGAKYYLRLRRAI